ncbi:MAG: DegT/DnrJ/EryC1/StrS family aminotransferase [Candidatus Omnitrophica bacterium]|nr:DegT/DnrJ/EryC1/StrS family aminotransferase [Candidatus Omnitrophota bacterium]
MARKFKVPALDLSREYLILKNDIQKELKDCFRDQEWILGSKVSRFEERLAKFLGVKWAVGCASGTDALILALRALAMKKKQKEYFDEEDEVITTPFTFIATAEAISRSGARPVFVDIDPQTFNIDSQKVKKAVNKNTVGIVPVHLYGLASEMDTILKVARESNLFVVEDVAQAFGGMHKKKKLGSLGNAGAFSFFPSKNLGSFGDAGAVATDDVDLAREVKILRNHGEKTRYNAEFIAYNSRLDSIQAAILLAKLKHVNAFNNLRRKVALMYAKALGDIPQIQNPFLPEGLTHAWCLYTIKVLFKRDKLCEFLNSKGVACRVYYPIPLFKMNAFRDAKRIGGFKATEEASSKVLSLPINPFIKENQINYVASLIRKFFRS